MMRRILLFSICYFLMFPTYAQNIFKKKSKEISKKIDDIEKKTKGCDMYEGLFTIYQSKEDGKSYLELDTSHLDKEYIYFSYYENGLLEAGSVKGRFRGSKIIKITRFYDNIDITVQNTKYFFDKESPLSNAANTNINNPLIISEKIIAKDNSKTRFLINADNIFLNESFQQVK